MMPLDVDPSYRGKDSLFKNHSSLVLNYKSEIIPPGVWVGIADLKMIQALTEGMGLPYPKADVEKIQGQLADVLEQVWGKDRLVVLPAEQLRAGMNHLAQLVSAQRPESMIVSFDPHYILGAAELETTRLIDPKSDEIIGKGPRPGAASIENQVAHIARIAYQERKRNIILADDVVFGGGTTEEAARLLNRHNLEVVGVIAGVAKRSTTEKLRKKGIYTANVYIAEDGVIDIVSFRDLIGPTPLGGRVVGVQKDSTVLPMMDQGGISFRALYLGRPLYRPIEWAGLPEDAAGDISVAGWELSEQLYQALGTLKGDDIKLGDLKSAKISTGFPDKPPKRLYNRNGQLRDSLNPEIPVRAVLEHKRKKAAGMPRKGTIFVMS